jgi:hypothetical protein
MKAIAYVAWLPIGTRAVLKGIDHPKAGQHCAVIGVLDNPSRAAKHQWYDVRFLDGSIGRFLEKYLSPVLR